MADSSTERLIELPQVLDLDALEAARAQLADAMEADAVAIDAAHLERIATNGVLLLLSAATTARRLGIGFRIGGATTPLRVAVARLGLGPHFAGLLEG
jgi:anti-anti-sigma regulatory factor